jgi:hypothetical protein
MSDEIEMLKEAEKEKAFSDDEGTAEECTGKFGGHWTGGLILIGMGVLFLLINNTTLEVDNWWALFILWPGVVNLGQAAKHYGRDGRFSGRVRHAFTWGLILTVVACTFFFNWSWGLVWPVFLIIFGLGALLSGVLDKG